MNVSFEQVVDEWSFMVQREESAAYSVKVGCTRSTNSSSPSIMESSKDQYSDRKFKSCPAGLREEICEWCYRVVDHCEIDRDVVGFAISYFDRYLATQVSATKTLIKLVAMTSLYLAAKLHSTRKISVSSMSSLSHGYFRSEQITKMEICIMKTLSWHLNPATPFIYINILSPLFENCSTDVDISTNAIDLSRYLVELSVCDDYFMDKKPSCIAYAAILVAMDVLAIPKKIFPKKYGFGCSPIVIESCIQRLHQVYNLALPEVEEDSSATSRASPSPTTVL